MKEIIEKVVLKYCSKRVKSFYPEAIIKDKQILASNVGRQEIVDFLDNCNYLQKIKEVRCPNCSKLLILNYYNTAKFEEGDELECSECDYEFSYNDSSIYPRYNVLHDKVPANQLDRMD